MAIANWNLNQVLAQLNSGARWTTPTISYAFPTSSSGMHTQGGEGPGFRPANNAQQSLLVLAMATWDDLIPQGFVPTTGRSDLEFGFTSTGIGYAHAYYPAVGSVYFNANESDLVSTSIGQYGFQTYVHEVGHALGLDHMGDYNGNGNWAPSSFQDSVVLSVMSYFGPRYAAPNYSAEVMQADWVASDNRTYSPQTPMVNDALAIQAIYGTSATTRVDSTVYGFNSTVGGALGALYDFTRNAQPILTLFDSAGVDTLDLSGWASNSRIDLRPGAYSSANQMTNNIAIAYSAVIENATGGAGNDVLIGNDAANLLQGGEGNDDLQGSAGDDMLVGGTGNDLLDGGLGNDTAVFEGAFSTYAVTVNGGTVNLSNPSSGNDRTTGVELFRFADGLRSIGDLSPGADTRAPVLQSLSPSDDAAAVPVAANLVLNFDEPVKPGSGHFSIYNADGSLLRSLAASDSTQVRFAGNSVTLDPALDLVAGRSYYVTVAPGAVTDQAGNAFAGFGNTTSWNFTAVAGDNQAPLITALSPTDDSSGVAPGAVFVMTFNEAVLPGSGNFTIRDGSSVVRSIAVGDSSQVTVRGNTVTLDPSSDLPAGRPYSITVDAGALRDVAGNPFAGLLSTTGWNFSVRAATVVDDFPNSTSTTGLVSVGAAATSGSIEVAGDQDLFRVNLNAGQTYTFALSRTAGGLTDPVLALFNASLNQIALDDDGGDGGNARLGFTASTTGVYYLGVFDYSNGTGGYSLQALVQDRQAPTLLNRSPVDNGTLIDPAANLVLTFSEAVLAGSGTIRVLDGNGTLVREIAVSDSNAVRISGTSVTVDPGANLPAGRSLFVNIDAGAFLDEAGNPFAGVFGSSAWNFDTRSQASGDDYPMSINTPGVLTVGAAPLAARIDTANDADLFRVDLVAGVTYRFDMVAPQTEKLDPFLTLYSLAPEVEIIASDDDSGPLPLDAALFYTAFQTGTYYLAAQDYREETGGYTLSVSRPSDDFLASTSSSGRVLVGGAAAAGLIEAPTDTDFFGVNLIAGRQYTVDLKAVSLADPYLVLLAPDGSLLGSDDDTGPAPFDSQFTFTAAVSGLHWIAAADFAAGQGSYRVSAFERLVVAGTPGADRLNGTDGPDSLLGAAGADRMSGGRGDDILQGGDSIDTAVMSGSAANFSVQRVEGGGWAFADDRANEGRDLLYGVERIEFSDQRRALDLDGDGHAAITARILGAVFGPGSVDNQVYVGIGLSLLDGGMSYPALMQLALDAALGAGASNGSVVNLLYSNVVGVLPDTPTRLYYEGLLSSGAFTTASLGVLAADTDLNIINIDLAGLAEVGLPYVPNV
jgi:methionine-rich copper-binding protein CopC